MRTEEELKEYEGKTSKDFEHLSEISRYNRNFYKGYNGDILIAESDDEDYTDWYLLSADTTVIEQKLGYSITSEGDKIHTNLKLLY